MAISRTLEHLYVIFESGNQSFAMPVRWVREMVPMPQVTKMPKLPPHVRGVINLRGQVMPLVDLRVRLGMISCHEESQILIDMFEAREEEHRQWLAELENSVKEKRKFNLATDPHECAFGKWYYAYDEHTSTNRCMNLDSMLRKFEDPHERIHAVAEHVLALAQEEDFTRAQSFIEHARATALAEMIEVFAEAKSFVVEQRRELAMVLGEKGARVALSVDLVEAVEMVAPDQTQEVSHIGLVAKDPIISGVGRRAKEDNLVLMLDVAEFFDTARQMAA